MVKRRIPRRLGALFPLITFRLSRCLTLMLCRLREMKFSNFWLRVGYDFSTTIDNNCLYASRWFVHVVDGTKASWLGLSETSSAGRAHFTPLTRCGYGNNYVVAATCICRYLTLSGLCRQLLLSTIPAWILLVRIVSRRRESADSSHCCLLRRRWFHCHYQFVRSSV